MAKGNFKTQIPERNRDRQKEIFISREGFSKILMNMEEAVIATDTKGVVVSMNKIAEELTGWKLSESEGKPIDDIFDAISEMTLLPLKNPISKALEENRPVLLSNHTILIKKDKTQRYIIDSAVPLHNDSSEIVGGALIFRDVTEMSLSKKKLAESEGLLKGIMANTSLVIYIKDLEGKYLFINRQKEKVYNIKSSEIVGKSSVTHLSPEDAEESIRTDRQVVKEKYVLEYQRVIKHPDGSLHTYHTSKFPLYDSENKIYAICAISTDISESIKNIEMTEKLASHEIIMASENQYDELTKNMPNLFFSIDHSLIYTSFNKACEKFTGKNADQVIGKTMEDAFPDGSPLFLVEYKEVLETGKTKNYISTFTFHENIFTYVINIYPTKKGVSILMTDLTMQKKSETEMLDMVDRLQKKNRDLRQFAYTVSHDLRAPIARVLGLVSLSNIDSKAKINNKTILENVVNEITILDDVVKDMNVIISVRDEGKGKEYIAFETELTLINNLLESEILKSKANITSDFKNAEGITTVKSYLYSIMYNLLSNAIKYRSESVPLTIHFQTEQDKDFVCLSVKDNGLGIDMKKNGDKIFGLYNRFHGKEIDGKGIGLNLVKTQTESLGGRVEVESRVNHGSTFKIFFPISHPENAPD